MRYLDKTFTLPAAPPRISQTEYEIRVGIRNPDGSLRQPKKKTKAK